MNAEKTTSVTIDEYIATFTPEIQSTLQKIRATTLS